MATTSSKRTGIYYHSDMLLHVEPKMAGCREEHVERPDRIKIPFEEIERLGLLSMMQRIPDRASKFTEHRLVHEMNHCSALVDALTDEDLHEYSCQFEDVFMCKDSYAAAVLACGGAIACCDAVCSNTVTNAFALVRYHLFKNKVISLSSKASRTSCSSQWSNGILSLK